MESTYRISNMSNLQTSTHR